MNIKQYKFVTEYLKWGNQLIAYKNAYQSKGSYKSIQSAANRLLNDPEVAKAIYESEARIRGEVEIAIANRQIKEILTIEEKRTLLKQIAAGTMYVEQKYKGKNCTQCSQYISPTINQMLAAIREDNKLAGHYPHKQNGKWIIPAAQAEEENSGTPENLQQNTTIVDPKISLPFRGVGGQPPQDENHENPQQFTTTEEQDATPLLFLGGDIGASASGGDKRQSGRLTREEQETQNENLPVRTPARKTESGWDVHPGGQQNTCPNDEIGRATESENEIDNQILTEGLETHDTLTVNTAGNIISQEKLRELLYPKHPKLMPMENEQQE